MNSMFFSSFVKPVISKTWWKINLAMHFFLTGFMESERKVIKSSARSYLGFQTPRWTWRRNASKKRYSRDLKPCSGLCSESSEETPLFCQENWWDESGQWRNDSFYLYQTILKISEKMFAVHRERIEVEGWKHCVLYIG